MSDFPSFYNYNKSHLPHDRVRARVSKNGKNNHNKHEYTLKIYDKTKLKNVKVLTDGNGLTNGNGLTDGNGLAIDLFYKGNSKYTKNQQRNRLYQLATRNKRKKYFEVFIAIILILLPLSIYLIEFDTLEPNIQIDGEFSDWKTDKITKYVDKDPEPIENPSTNLIDCRIQYQNNIMDFYVQTEFDMFGKKVSSTPSSQTDEIYKLDILIDHDLNPKTGYKVENLGADELIELQGKGGVVSEAKSYFFDQNKNNADWNGWLLNSNVNVAKDKFRLEGRHYLLYSTLNQMNTYQPNLNPGNTIWNYNSKYQPIGILIQMMDNKGNHDLTNTILANTNDWYQLRILDVSPDFITPSDNIIPLLTLDFAPQGSSQNTNNNLPLEFHMISWKIHFNDLVPDNQILDIFKNIRLYIDQNCNNQIEPFDYQLNDYEITYSTDKHLQLNFSPPLYINHNCQKHYLLTLDTSLKNYSSKLMCLNLYPINVEASAPIVINMPNNSDHELVMYLGKVPKGITIDGIFTDWDSSINKLNDVDIPINPDYNQDRDIYKVSLINDPGSNSLSFYLSVHGNLLQGSAIPPVFNSEIITFSSNPANNGQKKTPVEVKNIEDSKKLAELPQELLGTDTISIFIDIDQNINTGYNSDWLSIGAEYLIKITGREGLIFESEILKYNNNPNNNWNWIIIGDLPACKDINQLETQINWLDFNLKSISNANVIFYISDWVGKTSDSSQIAYSNGIINNILKTPFIFDDSLEPNNLNDELENKLENILDENQENNNLFTNSSSRATIVHPTDTNQVTDIPSQRKLVRDANGYWYAFWYNQSQIMAKRSSDILGTSWTDPPILLAGGVSPIILGTNGGQATHPSVAIKSHPTDVSKEEIHLVWTHTSGGVSSIYYSKVIDITTYDNFKTSSNWVQGDGITQGYDILENQVNFPGFPFNGYPSIAIDRFGHPHVVFQYSYALSDAFINYTVYNNTNGWHNGVVSSIQISPKATGLDYRFPCIDVGYNGTIHVAYQNSTASPYKINYRHCWSPGNSMAITNWGNISHVNNWDDIAITNISGGTMEKPSLICNSTGSVWIVTYEGGVGLNNVWFSVENFEDTIFWDRIFVLASDGDNTNPTIGYDDSGTVYCVWQYESASGNKYIRYSHNSSNNWIAPIAVVSGENIFPQIPENVTYSDNLISFIYKNTTLQNLMFLSVPEISNFVQLIVIILFIHLLIMIPTKKNWIVLTN